MTEILLPRPTSGQVPDYIPVSNQALSYDLKDLLFLEDLLWLQDAKAGEGLINTDWALKATGMLAKDSVDYKLITKIGGKFYVLSGMKVTKTSDTSFSVGAGTAVINGVEHTFQKRDLVMSVATSPDGVYTINVNDVLGIYSNMWHYFSENILAYLVMQGGVITHIFDAPVRSTPLFNVLSNLAGAIGIVTKNIAIIPTGTDTIKRTQGVFIGRMSEEISLPELSPAQVEIVNKTGSRIGVISSNLNMHDLHRIDHGPNLKPTEYAVLPYFVRRSGVITFVTSQAVLTDVSHIEDVHIKHILNQYTIPAELSREAGMIGVLIIKGDETSLTGPGAYYYSLTLNKNTVLRSTGHQLPTLTNSDTGLLHYDDSTNLFDLKPQLGINPQDGDFFVKKNNQFVNARETFENLKYPGFGLRDKDVTLTNYKNESVIDAVTWSPHADMSDSVDSNGNTNGKIRIRIFVDMTASLIIMSLSAQMASPSPILTPPKPCSIFARVKLGRYGADYYNTPNMMLSMIIKDRTPRPSSARRDSGTGLYYWAFECAKTFLIPAVKPVSQSIRLDQTELTKLVCAIQY